MRGEAELACAWADTCNQNIEMVRFRVRLRRDWELPALPSWTWSWPKCACSKLRCAASPLMLTLPNETLNCICWKLWRRCEFVDLRTRVQITFVLKWRWVLEPFMSYHCWTKFWWEEKWHFSHRTLSCLAVFHETFGKLYESCWS